MRVKAIRDHFHDGAYRTAGEQFELVGKLHSHITEVKAPAPAKEDGDEEGDGKPAAQK